MTRRIAMIIPVNVPAEALSAFAGQFDETETNGCDVEFLVAADGGAALDSQYEGTLADFYCLQVGVRAANEGFDAICINSMSDSGVSALRSRLSVPIIGTGIASYLLALHYGTRFTVLTMWDRWNWLYEKVLSDHGLNGHLASIRSIGQAPDAERLLQGKEDEVSQMLIEAARKAIEVDRCDVLILGSTTMYAAHSWLSKAVDVPIINPGLAGLKACQTALDLNLSQSKVRYRPPAINSDSALAIAPKAI